MPYAGQVVPVRVAAFNRLGEPVDDPELTWTSSNASVAAVDPAGLVFARSAGSATISVSGAGVHTDTEIQVRPDPGMSYALQPMESRVRTGDVIRFSATAEASGGEAIQAFPEWSLSGVGAQIEDEGGEGVFVAEEPGTYRVTARMGERDVVSGVVIVELVARTPN